MAPLARLSDRSVCIFGELGLNERNICLRNSETTVLASTCLGHYLSRNFQLWTETVRHTSIIDVTFKGNIPIVEKNYELCILW